MMVRSLVTTTIAAAVMTVSVQGRPVDDYGALKVVGNEIRGKNNQVARLRGMSFYWSQAKAGRDFYNASVVNWLATDWQANVVRAAMAIEGNWSPVEQGYLSDPATNKSRVKAVVDAAIQKGIYVLIDWHDHNAMAHQSQAVSFFSEMAQTYGQYPNVIYETYNEPDDESWSAIKSYSVEVIKAIRQHDSDNLIIIGTPKWSSEVDQASQSPITGYANLAYSFHFYASETWHYNNYRQKADAALQNGIALFVTEWGCSEASGSGNIDFNRVNAFMTWMESKKLSWCNWSICDLSETSAALKAGTWNSQGNLVHSVSTTGGWSASDLSQSGTYVRSKLRDLNMPYVSVMADHFSADRTVPGSAAHVSPKGRAFSLQKSTGNRQISSSVLDFQGRASQHSKAAVLTIHRQ